MNGRFDQLDSATGAPISWLRCLLNADGACTFFVDTSGGKDGRSSLVLKNSGSGAVWWQQTVDAVPNKAYRVSGNIKCKDVAGGAQIQVTFLDTYGGFIHEVKLLPGTESVFGTTDWTALGREIKVPKEATAADIRLILVGYGMGWFDDIKFNPLPWA